MMNLQNLRRLQPYLCILAALFIFYFLYTYGLGGGSQEKFIGGAEEEEETPTETEEKSTGASKIMLPAYLTSAKPEPEASATLPADADSHLLIEVPSKITCEKDADCNIIYGKGKNKCVSGKCSCQEGAGTFCHKRPNYYLDPREMSPAQVIKFKKKAKIEKMTIGDYKNWLMLFKYDQENLPRHHLRNFERLMMGQPIYEIPLSDPVEEFFADQAARSDRVCLDIPNAEIDSPLNWKIRSQLNNTGKIDRLGRTERPLNWSRYYKHPSLNKDRYQRTDRITAKDWFLQNINWLFYDIDRNQAYKDPNQNRFMNVIGDARKPQPGFQPQSLNRVSSLAPTQEGTIAPANNLGSIPSRLGPTPVDMTTGVAGGAGGFAPISKA